MLPAGLCSARTLVTCDGNKLMINYYKMLAESVYKESNQYVFTISSFDRSGKIDHQKKYQSCVMCTLFFHALESYWVKIAQCVWFINQNIKTTFLLDENRIIQDVREENYPV